MAEKVKSTTLFVMTNGACATYSALPCCRNRLHKHCVLATKNFNHTAHNFPRPQPPTITMAAMGSAYVPECASCHKSGNMACKGCLLVTVSHPSCLLRSLVTENTNSTAAKLVKRNTGTPTSKTATLRSNSSIGNRNGCKNSASLLSSETQGHYWCHMAPKNTFGATCQVLTSSSSTGTKDRVTTRT